MNKRQKIVQQRFLNNEEEITQALEKTYETALADVNKKIKNLQLDIDGIQGQLDVWEDFGGDEAEKAKLQSMLQSKVYQKRYQETIQGQLDDVLDKMHTESYKSVDAYLNGCYDEAYIGAFYDMHGQGVPIVAPINQESVVRAVQLDSKISNGLYSRLGEDVAGLKKAITAEVSRGIANGSSYAQVAQQITFKMVGAYEDKAGGALYRALTIARTEGGRIQSQSAMDACYKARDIGADVVKQWDSTLDNDTRKSHKRVDGEIRELDEPFSNGLDYPRDPSGGAAEVVNCRCALLQRARWAVEGGFSKMNNFTKEIETFESPEDYDEFKKAFWSKENQDFMKHHTSLEKKYGTKDFKKLLESMDDEEYARYMKLYGNSPIYNKAAKATAKKAVTKPSFTPAKTRAEAEAFAKSLGVDADYSKYDISVANAMNETMQRTVDEFGSHSLDALKTIKNDAKGKGRAGGFDWFSGNISISGVSGKDALSKMGEKTRKANQRYEKMGMKYFSANGDLHTIHHEVGHAVHCSLGGSLDTASTALDKDIISFMKGRTDTFDEVSYYATLNNQELVAECVAQYYDGSASETTLGIIDILKKYALAK